VYHTNAQEVCREDNSMKTSTDRILTTHTGSLPRPQPLVELILKREAGEGIDPATFEAATVAAVEDVVARQVAAGVDVVSDGEMSKPSYTTYIRAGRLRRTIGRASGRTQWGELPRPLVPHRSGSQGSCSPRRMRPDKSGLGWPASFETDGFAV